MAVLVIVVALPHLYCGSGSGHCAGTQKLYCSALSEPLLASSVAWPTYLAICC